MTTETLNSWRALEASVARDELGAEMARQHDVDRVSDPQVVPQRPRLIEQRANTNTAQWQLRQLGEHPASAYRVPNAPAARSP